MLKYEDDSIDQDSHDLPLRKRCEQVIGADNPFGAAALPSNG